MECNNLLINFYLKILGEQLSIQISDGKDMYYYKSTGKTLILDVCLEEREYEVIFKTNTVNTISYTIKLNNSFLKSEELKTFKGSYKFLMKPSSTETPSLQLMSRRLYYGVTYYLHPFVINGKGCTSFSLNENNILPPSMIFNPADGSISGTLKSKFVQTLEINCINDGMKYPSTVNYIVEECPPYSIQYELKIVSSENGDNLIIILRNTVEEIYSIHGVENSREYLLSGCIQNSTFQITLDSKNNQRWGNSYMIFTFNGEARLFRYVNTSVIITEKNYQKVNLDPKWFYSDILENDWNNNFDFSKWRKIELSKLPRVETKIRYYRLVYDLIIDYELLDTLIVTSSFNGGMILYVNGIEIVRKNLPESADSGIMSINKDLDSNFEVEVTGNILRQGRNYIGVEIHRDLDKRSIVEDLFRMDIIPLISRDKCVAKTLFSFMPLSMSDEKNIGINFINTIDLDLNTIFLKNINSQNFSQEIIYRYPNNIMKPFNEYSIITSPNCSNTDLMSWKFSGVSANEGKYQLLDNITDSKMIGDSNQGVGPGRSTLYSYKLINTSMSFTAYKIDVNSIRSLNNKNDFYCINTMSFSELYVSNCQEVICESKDGYQSTRINTKSFKNCENGKTGRIERLCVLEDDLAAWSTEIENCENISSSITYNSTDLIFIVGEYNEYVPILGEGIKGYFEMIGDVPKGVKINEITGKIYGVALYSSSPISFYVFCNYQSGTNLITQKLIIESKGKLEN